MSTREELLKDIEGVAAGAKQLIEDGKDCRPVLLLIDFPKGEITPLVFMNGISDADRIVARRSSELAAASGATAIVFSSEVWGASMKATPGEDPNNPKDPEAAKLLQLARERKIHTLPGRREFLMVTGASPGAKATMLWEILRDDRGQRRVSEIPVPQPAEMENFFTDDLPWPKP